MSERIVGNYKILEKIGAGGMGDVMRGLDLMLEREVAIKILHSELLRQPQVVDRFRSEAIALARLNHTNIATLYNFFRHGDEFYMVMEFVHGKTLAALISESGIMQCDRAVGVLIKALDGISHAHGLGIVHRDIKPANIMCTDKGLVEVMDFGIARIIGSARLTREGHLVGTIEYMSPEQVRGEEGDERSDLYADGVRTIPDGDRPCPFRREQRFRNHEIARGEAPGPPARFRSGAAGEGFEDVILLALEKDPQRRFQSAAAMKTALMYAVPMTADAQDGPGMAALNATMRVLAVPVPLRHTPPKETRIAGRETPGGAPPVPPERV